MGRSPNEALTGLPKKLAIANSGTIHRPCHWEENSLDFALFREFLCKKRQDSPRCGEDINVISL